jgi:uncharacterized caspase-like protein
MVRPFFQLNRTLRTITVLMCCILNSISFSNVSHGQQKRVALVIGNSAYQHTAALRNPKNDAAAISNALANIGFSVTTKLDLDYRGLREAIRSFGAEASSADIALIHFAGHGLEVGGENYLVPVDARLQRDTDLEYETVTLTSVLRATVGATQLRMVIVDACRNNPLNQRMVITTGRTRGVNRGLAAIEPEGDVLVAYSAKAGTVAQDGDGDLSPYAEALSKHLKAPGLDIRILFGRVRDDVKKATRHQQEPFIYGSLKGEIITLVPGSLVSDNKAIEEIKRFAEEQATRAKAAEQEAKRNAEDAELKRVLAENEAKRLSDAKEAAAREYERSLELERQERRRAADARRETLEQFTEAERRNAASGKALLRLCNRAGVSVSVAIAHESVAAGGTIVEGWWSVEDDKCWNVGYVQASHVYVFARVDDSNRETWTGSDTICIIDENFFRLKSDIDCSEGEEVEFWKLDLQERDAEIILKPNGRLEADRKSSSSVEDARQSRRAAELAEDKSRRIAEWNNRSDNSLPFTIVNNSGGVVNYKLFSMDRPGHQWPAADRQWFVLPGRTVGEAIRCKSGERVCVGATGRNGSAYWGVGMAATESCQNCCASCDGRSFKYSFGK